jgi:hypothetical protein
MIINIILIIIAIELFIIIRLLLPEYKIDKMEADTIKEMTKTGSVQFVEPVGFKERFKDANNVDDILEK